MARASKREEYETWDWTRQDIALAELHGVSRERVRQIRRQLNKGEPFNKRRRRKALECFGKTIVV